MQKKSVQQSINLYLVILIVLGVAILLIVTVVALWQVSVVKELRSSVVEMQRLNDDLTGQLVNNHDDVIDDQDKDTVEAMTGKTYNHDWFSFEYPGLYIADENGLWTEDGYKLHIDSLDTQTPCSTCHISHYQIKVENTDLSLDEYIIDDFDLPGSTLDDVTARVGIPYRNLTIGDHDFIKIRVSDLFDTTSYYTKKGNKVISFSVYWPDRDTEEFHNIIASLKVE